MNKYIQKYALISLLLSLMGVTASAQNMSDYAAVPPLSVRDSGPSNIMLTLSLDHQLFFEAYNDYEDIVGDSLPETTYTHTNPATNELFEYAGYFASDVCYDYVASGQEGQFEPAASADSNGYCTSGGWSGNFLNWLSMTRMDLVRYVLYGGYRSVDTTTATVLERAYLPQDAHSFAKFYDGADLANLTDGLTGSGYTFCNTSRPTVHNSSGLSVNSFSHLGAELTTPPLLRIVEGDYSLWASNERYQCSTRNEMPGQNQDYDEQYLAYVNDFGFGTNGNVNPERSGISASPIAPLDNQVTDIVVRVAVCKGVDVDPDRCMEYGSNYKPYGVLQLNDTELRNFGLITGSYFSNKDYGALRKNLASLSTEINEDGTFVARPISEILAANSATTPASIIGTLNAARLAYYQYWDSRGNSDEGRNSLGTYNTNCNWGWGSFNNGQCVNWGNPFSELLVESYRYFAKAPQASVNVAGNEAGFLPGLPVDTWPQPDPQDEGEACAKNSVVAFNTSAVSYDGDILALASPASLNIGAPTDTTSIAALTNAIGSGEQLSGEYFVGEVLNSTDPNDGLCSAKTVNGALASVRGTCPETPRSGGSYLGAGLAHFVHTNDVIPGTEEIDTIQTYGVSLAAEVPTIRITGADRTVTIVPSCRNLGLDEHTGTPIPKGNCALVDFRPIRVDQSSGFYYVGWEDSEQGGDYDLDISGTIEYQISGTDLLIDSHIFYESANDDLEFGYAVTGTGNPSADGIYFPSRVTKDNPNSPTCLIETIENGVKPEWCGDEYPDTVAAAQAALDEFSEVDEETATAWCTASNTCASSIGGDTRKQRVTLSLALSEQEPAKLLEPPLFYAAKWGSFDKDDENNPDVPDRDSEWKRNDGSMIGYEGVSNPIALREKLNKTISKAGTLPTVATGTNSVSTSLTGEGVAIQTFYYPEKETEDGDIVWVGTMTALFVDRWGYLREDTNSNGQLDDPPLDLADEPENVGIEAADRVVRVVFNEETQTSVIYRHTLESDPTNETGQPVRLGTATELPFSELDNLAYLWKVDLDGVSDYVDQRTSLTSGLDSGRHIITAIDIPDNGQLDGQIDKNIDGTIPFDVEESGASLAPLLDVGTQDEANELINFIRGVESETTRSRTGDNKSYLLGDIINSSPEIVGRPSGDYLQKYSDTTYAAYTARHTNRKNMVYVGANDGMLHAFDLGYYDASQKAYFQDAAKTQAANHNTLAKEKWAYVPYNLLPHLKWLAQEEYSHVYYMDGPVNVFDVNIFPEATHPGGWGTILVAGMRFGGGEYTLTDGDGASRTLRSAYVIFDVTNPDDPQLLGEITHPNLGFTTSNVELIVRRDIQGPTDGSNTNPSNSWHLVFGSGPTGPQGLKEAVSDQNAHIFYLDLNDLANGTVDLTAVDTEVPKSFVGGVTPKDWDGDYYTDAVYFGLVGDGETQKGRLMHTPVAETGVPFIQGDVVTLLNDNGSPVDLPFSAAPTVVSDIYGNCWVYAVSGRFYVNSDAKSSDEQNTIFGLNVKNGVVDQGDLLDVSGYRVLQDADGTDTVLVNNNGDFLPPTLPGVETGSNVSVALVGDVVRTSLSGWKRDFQQLGEKSYISPLFANDTVVAGTFNPVIANVCEAEGRSYVYALDMSSGLSQVRRSSLVTGSEGAVVPELSEVEPIIADTAGAINEFELLNGNTVSYNTNDGGTGKENLGDDPPPPQRRAWREVNLQ